MLVSITREKFIRIYIPLVASMKYHLGNTFTETTKLHLTMALYLKTSLPRNAENRRTCSTIKNGANANLEITKISVG